MKKNNTTYKPYIVPSAEETIEKLKALQHQMEPDASEGPYEPYEANISEEEIEAVCREIEAGEYSVDITSDPAGIEDDSGNIMPTDQVYYMHMDQDIYMDPGYVGNVYGRFVEESGSFYALSRELDGTYDITDTGLIIPEDLYNTILRTGYLPEGYSWFGTCVGGEWRMNRTDCELSPIIMKDRFSFITKAFSRNAGLIETDIMQDKAAIIVGQGSVGSYVSMQLVKAGVGRFVLIDSDTLEIHNLSRHWLSLAHLGEYKVNAMRHEIRQVNPFADVRVYKGYAQDAPESLYHGIEPGRGIVISTGDNRASAAAANRLAKKLGLPFIAVGCWQRACSGEVFTWTQDTGLPEYSEVFDGLISDERNEAHRMYLGEEKDAESIHFQPGIYVDITFVTDIAVKLALDMLNMDTKGYIPRVYDKLTNYTLICNTNKIELGGRTAGLFPGPLFVSDWSNGIWLERKGQAAELTFDFNVSPGTLY